MNFISLLPRLRKIYPSSTMFFLEYLDYIKILTSYLTRFGEYLAQIPFRI